MISIIIPLFNDRWNLRNLLEDLNNQSALMSIVIGSAANGIYSISNKFSNVLGVLENVLYTSWAEAAAVHINDEDRDDFFSKVFNTELSLFGFIGTSR